MSRGTALGSSFWIAVPAPAIRPPFERADGRSLEPRSTRKAPAELLVADGRGQPTGIAMDRLRAVAAALAADGRLCTPAPTV